MAQVFVRIANSQVRWKVGTFDWIGVPMLPESTDFEPVDPDSEEARAELENVMSNVPGIALAPIDGTTPHQFAITNPFRVDREKGHLLMPDSSMGSARAVRWNFRERILDIWKGRNGFKLPERKTVLREFLKYHWEHGGNRPALFDYLGSMPDEQWPPEEIPGYIMLYRPTYTAPLIEKALAEEMRAWIDAAQASAKALASIAEGMPSMQVRFNLDHEHAGGTVHPNAEAPNPAPIIYPKGMAVDPEAKARELHERQVHDFIPGLSICSFPKFLMVGYRDTYPETDVVLSVNERLPRDPNAWGEIDRVVRLHRDTLPAGTMRDRMEGWKYASIAPAGTPNPFDISNPRTYLLDGIHVPKADYWEHVKGEFLRTLRAIWTEPYKYPPNRKSGILVEYLDHHFDKGGNPKALVDHVEGLKPSAPLPEGLQKALAAWVVSARERLGSPAKVKAKPTALIPTAPTLATKFDAVPGSLTKWMNLLRSEGLVDEAGRFTMASDVRGKGKLIAAWDAAQSVFSLLPFPSGAAFMRALNTHFEGLDFSGRLDRVRFTNDFDAVRDGYKEVLRGN